MYRVGMAATQIPAWTLGDRLRKARVAAGIPRQGDMAAKLHVARATVNTWETDTHEPNWPTLEAWARITNVSLRWLVTGEEGEGGVTDQFTVWKQHNCEGQLSLLAAA